MKKEKSDSSFNRTTLQTMILISVALACTDHSVNWVPMPVFPFILTSIKRPSLYKDYASTISLTVHASLASIFKS